MKPDPISENNSLLFGLDLNDEALHHELRQSAEWGRKMAVAAIVLQALLLIGSFSSFITYQSYSQITGRGLSRFLVVRELAIGTLHLISGIGFIFVAVYFLRYARMMKQALDHGEQQMLVESIRKLRAAFQISFGFSILSACTFIASVVSTTLYPLVG